MAAQLQCNSVQLQQCKEIMKSHNCSSPIQSDQDLWRMLHEGVLIDNIYYSLDKQLTSYVCGVVFQSTYNHLEFPTRNTGNMFQRRFHVTDDFNRRELSQGTEYEILFDIELAPGAHGWKRPVTFEYKSPTGSGKFEQNLSSLIGQGQRQVSIGKFTNSSCASSCIAPLSFHMFQHGDQWKNGLIMRGVVIRPALLACN